MINYPNGKSFLGKQKSKSTFKVPFSHANRGMDLENAINQSNSFYKENNKAYILKRPTPIHIVKVDYKNNQRIIDAYFESKSTTDYNGLYKGKYIDFEAKVTNSKTSFPLSNIRPHQLEHLKNVINADGIAFFIIYFAFYDEYYLLEAKKILSITEKSKNKSIKYEYFEKNCPKIEQSLSPRLKYLDVVEKLYF